MTDDILAFGSTAQEHDRRLHAALERLKEAKITLNPEKCALSRPSVKFIVQVVGEGGIRTDPDKIAGVYEMPSPNNVGEVRRFLGLVIQQAKYLPNLAERTEPLRALLKKSCHWVWGEPQQKAYDAIKKDLTQTRLGNLRCPEGNDPHS